jgi:hypothetical protein
MRKKRIDKLAGKDNELNQLDLNDDMTIIRKSKRSS